MILLDTHIWIWWVSSPDQLRPHDRSLLASTPFAVSIISCWEIAKLVEYGRLKLDRPVTEWLDLALLQPGLELLPLTPAIAVESTRLPQPFHRDPADQIVVATARHHGIPLLTYDGKILEYPHVQLA